MNPFGVFAVAGARADRPVLLRSRAHRTEKIPLYEKSPGEFLITMCRTAHFGRDGIRRAIGIGYRLPLPRFFDRRCPAADLSLR